MKIFINGGFYGKSMHKWRLFKCHVWVEGTTAIVIGGIPLGIAFSDRWMEKRMVFLPFLPWKPTLLLVDNKIYIYIYIIIMINFRNSKIGAQFWLFLLKRTWLFCWFLTHTQWVFRGLQALPDPKWDDQWQTSRLQQAFLVGWITPGFPDLFWVFHQAVECFSSRPQAMIASIWVSSVLQPRPTALMRVSSWDTMPLWRNGNGGVQAKAM